MIEDRKIKVCTSALMRRSVIATSGRTKIGIRCLVKTNLVEKWVCVSMIVHCKLLHHFDCGSIRKSPPYTRIQLPTLQAICSFPFSDVCESGGT